MKTPFLLSLGLAVAATAAMAQDRDVEYGGRVWHLTPGCRIDGDLLTVSIPEGLYPQTQWARTEIDLAQWENKGFEARVRARGETIATPTEPWLGFKFMLSYRDRFTGAMRYPGGGAPLGSFPWMETSFRQMSWFRGADGPGILHLGLQGTSGTAVFDLSTLEIGDLRPLWPVTNQTHRCAYTPDRGVESPAPSGDMRGAPGGRALPDGGASRPGEPVGADLRAARSLRGFMSPSGREMTEDDFATLASWGATLLRYQMVRDWHGVGTNQDLDEYDRWLDGKLDHVEGVVLPMAAKYGLKVVLDLHVTPGGRDASHEMNMFHDARFAGHFVECWRRIARRFRGNAGVVYGYDLCNEPQQQRAAPPGLDGWNLQRRAAEAIREIDPDTPVVVECNVNDAPAGYPNMSPFDLPNVIYEVHMYGPGDFTHQGIQGMSMDRCRWPDESRGWNRDYLRSVLAPVRDFQLRHGARIYVGEFSAVAWAEGADAWLRDAIATFAEYGWDWTYHAFREWRGWSIEHEGPDIDHMAPSTDNPRKRALLDGLRAR